MSDPFTELEHALAALREAEKRIKRAEKNKCDWDDPEERLRYVREYKRRARRARLERLVPGLRCPLCQEVKVKSRSWVIFERRLVLGNEAAKGLPHAPEVAVCRSCVLTYFKEELWKK